MPMKFLELPSNMLEGEECERAGCDQRLGAQCWWSQEAPETFFCSNDCAVRQYGATRGSHPAGKRLPAGDPFRSVPLDDGKTTGVVKAPDGQLYYRMFPT